MSAPLSSPSRRRFVAAGGALVLSFPLGPALAADKPGLPGSLKTEPMLDAWIRIDAAGAIAVCTGKAELGQGIKTALLQLAAEELLVAPSRLTLITADTVRTPDEKYTAGSHSMQDSGTAIRHAAAQVRVLLLGLAAQRLDVAAAQLRVADGVITAPDGRRVGYGELLAGQQLHVRAQPQSTLIDPAQHRVVGKPLQRIDIPAKVSGGAAYVHDLRLPGMVHARVVRPPAPGARLLALDDATVRQRRGVLQVVRDGSFVGVVADGQYQAIKAAAALAQACRWSAAPPLPDQRALYDDLLAAPAQTTVIARQGTVGTTSAAGTPGTSARTLTARYRRPFQLHASLGPSCAVAQYVDGSYTVWTHSQGVYPLRTALAEMLGVKEERIRCIHMEGAGCYGHNGADDVAADAVLLARALPGRPVRVQWMREDEHGWEPYGPPMVAEAQATLDPGGAIIGWQYQVWSPPHNARPGKAGNLLAATHLAKPFAPPPAKPIPQPEGGGDRNAVPLYALPNLQVTHHFLPRAPMRVSALRSLGAYCNVFAIESFMDELARLAQSDPVAFRLRHMTDPRAQAVMREAADRFGWQAYQRKPGRGRGYAFARYKNLGAYAAIALEVEVARESGYVRVTRAVAAVDSGEAVNPDGIRNQIEGGILQSLSWSLCEEVSWDALGITSRDWAGYPILRFPQMPDRVEVHILDRPGQPFLGTGEAAQGPAAAALANAVADATGVRLRDLPLRRERVRAQL
ncbi:xanthine dehydrogenase family protein molybdopterin-binding subunit [Duganella callida]|uniref:Xanthine dehydrogenase family protein molybdopterin-binding subunit n=1 Tax=Duganella callida TaxID=2561932 RepID=A0A4Y9SQ73_9BURK|nr:molybdopterin cofactor-binding domain-containing protein [Duganella callida]TFW28820.1 xanthine dehydrogenase family protein molybdopterin-binding subunit [Duganella callida]